MKPHADVVLEFSDGSSFTMAGDEEWTVSELEHGDGVVALGMARPSGSGNYRRRYVLWTPDAELVARAIDDACGLSAGIEVRVCIRPPVNPT